MPENSDQMKIEKIDPYMKISKFSDLGLKWFDPKELPGLIKGFPWLERDCIYRRLPKNPEYTVPEPVNLLADCTSGGQVRLKTDTSKLAVRVKLAGSANMNHMPATGQCGFDCYIGMGESLNYCSTSKYDHKNDEYEFLFFDLENNEQRDIILNFPLYKGVKELLIGVDDNTKVLEPYPFKNSKRVVFYGSSITQGGCASRPGMSYTNIISRRLDMECVNLGFSGNGKGEPELARIICEISDPGCIVLDYEANTFLSGILQKTLGNFIAILREVHKEVPILVLSKIRYANENFNPSLRRRREENALFQKGVVEDLRSKGDKYLFFYDGSQLLDEDFEECTVDGVHPTDLGFYRIAGHLTEVIKSIVKI